MKLTNKENKKPFGELKITDCFMYNDALFMKTCEMINDVNVVCNAIRFDDGRHVHFTDADSVIYKPDAELFY